MNCYVSLDEIKTLLGLNLSDREKDVALMLLLNRVSRRADAYCGRHFYCETATRERWIALLSNIIFVDDLISITTLKEIDINDIVTTIASTTYDLQPLTGYPKTSLRRKDGTWTQGCKLQIVGKFGYSDTSDDSGDTVQNDPLTSSGTLLTVSNGKNFSVGQTLPIENEQVFVLAISANALTIRRGVNGTTGASHIKTTAISIQTYPSGIVDGVVTSINLQLRGTETRPDDANAEGYVQGKVIHPDVRALWNRYVRHEARLSG